MQQHDLYMRRVLDLARSHPRAPFAAILLDTETNEIVAEGLNHTHTNPLMHGEVDAIHRYATSSANRWGFLRLYTTAEPCCMCQGAIIWAGIPEVVYGTSILQLKEFGWNQIDLRAEDIIHRARFAQCKITGGILGQECDTLFKQAMNDSA